MIRKSLALKNHTLCLPAGWVIRPHDTDEHRWQIVENGTALDSRPGCESAFKRALEIIENRRRHCY
jgi:hypothetical protein